MANYKDKKIPFGTFCAVRQQSLIFAQPAKVLQRNISQSLA
jgi:hypothetical protein